ncbi:MAG TPA: hypothetical protein VFT74_00320 [Isosphaeraceae bacterium]|nr:hypothetical protein [Isosphaeraceae bacterium]
MSTQIQDTARSDTAILSRVIRVDDEDLSTPAAEAFLQLRLGPQDLDRMHELAVKNQEDRLTPSEGVELDSYRRVSFLLDLMHSKARRALKKHQSGS